MTNTIKIVGLIFFCISVYSCHSEKKEKATPPIPVTTMMVKEEKVDYFEEYPGTVNPLNEVVILSQVTGAVTDIYFVDGQKVTKNQRLYSIDNKQFKATYNQALANLDAAKADLEKAQKDADRYQFLLQKDAVARQTVDYAVADLETAKMKVKAAEEEVVDQSVYLRYSEITAPVAGTIGFSNVKKGALVTAGNTVLNTVASNDPIGVDFYLNEKEILHFMSNIKTADSDSLFTILLPDQSLYPFPGKIYAIDRTIDPKTATLKIRLSFPNTLETIKEGMSCTVRMKVYNDKALKLIPFKAIVEEMGEYFVYILSSDSTVKEQKITTGQTIGNNVEVEDGLAPEKIIIVDGVQNLKPGSKVTITKIQ